MTVGFSRYVVGWLLAERESAEFGKRLIEVSCQRQGILPGQLTLHSDRGAPMTSKTMKQLLDDLVATRSFSRPRVSNDNPFSEAQFKTMKRGGDRRSWASCEVAFPLEIVEIRRSAVREPSLAIAQ